MQQIPFREKHLLSILDSYDKDPLSLDRLLYVYYKGHRSLGSKDRKEISENLYCLFRWKGLIDHFTDKPNTWSKRIDTWKKLDTKALMNDPSLPIHIRLSFPKQIVDRLIRCYGLEQTELICKASNTKAPLTIRVNPIKISRDELFDLWKDKLPVKKCRISHYGLSFKDRLQLLKLPEFHNGFFEVMDEGSQLVAELVDPQPGDQVLDYCSGSGGKTLAFAPKLKNTGQIYLHDIRPGILQEAKKRLRRAGIQNVQVLLSGNTNLLKLKKKMDWVLVDAPCSGTGTLRRNPDMKWNFDEKKLLNLVGQQRIIFEEALSYLKPGGMIVYATCSILSEENQLQIDHFLSCYPLKLTGVPLQILPGKDNMDGFFAAVFKKSN